MTAASPPVGTVGLRSEVRRWLPLAGLVVGALALQLLFSGDDAFPARWDSTFESPIDDAGDWLRSNRSTHPVFTAFFSPLSRGIDAIITGISDFLLWVPWFVVIAAAAAIPARVRMYRAAITVAVALAYTGVIGLWTETMQTLGLMSAAVLLAVVIGLPLGILAALKPGFETILRPFLDIMQTVPAFVYFLPLFMLFGIGNVPGAVATLIYALPPVVRLTTLGIRTVPPQAVEASQMYGARRRQTLTKVQLPMAIPSIITGLSQTIMLALGVVVLATLVGASGLGSPVLQSLNQRRTGRGIAAGLAIMAVAMVLDRIWRSAAERDPLKRHPRNVTLVGLGILAVGALLGRVVGAGSFPEVFDWTLFDPVDDVVTWIRDNLRWLTRPLSDSIVTWLYLPARDLLTDTLAWPVVVFVGAWACWRMKGWGLALFTASSLVLVGLFGLWELSIDTLVQVLLASAMALALALPIGIWAGRRPRIEAALGPILDGLQTVPSLVYIIPAVIFFTVGVVPGIMATVLYAMVPGVRITALGIREVATESLEASRTFGATPRQTLLGVRIPLAAPTIMAGVNQVIMMSLAMVIISGLVGGGGLGFETVVVLKRSRFGLGFEVAVALVALAMILDRFTEAAADRLQPHRDTGL
ncbi:MAG: ABC transporter permease subunit [Acidimicrobiales bacterium]|nr:ABC transporter permease subunit [Acidimicrobiales bacterium]